MCFYIFDWAYYIIVQLQFFFKINIIILIWIKDFTVYQRIRYFIKISYIVVKFIIIILNAYQNLFLNLISSREMTLSYTSQTTNFILELDSTRYQEKEVHEPLHLVTNSFLFLLKVVQVTSAGDGRSLAAKLKSIASKSGLLIVLSFSFVVFFQVYCTVAN